MKSDTNLFDNSLTIEKLEARFEMEGVDPSDKCNIKSCIGAPIETITVS
jgi:hypothetical protein